MDIKKIENRLSVLKAKLADKAHQLKHATIREAKETYEAALILLHMSQGKEVSEEEIEFLKHQSVDVGKAVALIGLQVIPFSSAGIIAIEVIANKHGFSVFPTSQTNEKTQTNTEINDGKTL